MIISFIKVGLMIGLTSIGNAIYQTLKNAQSYEIEDEEVKRAIEIKLLRDCRKKDVNTDNNYVVDNKKYTKDLDYSTIEDEYIYKYKEEIVKNIQLCDLELMQLKKMYSEIDDNNKKTEIIEEIDSVQRRKNYWLEEEDDIKLKHKE